MFEKNEYLGMLENEQFCQEQKRDNKCLASLKEASKALTDRGRRHPKVALQYVSIAHPGAIKDINKRETT